MLFSNWLSNNYIEVFGAITGIIYVILEIKQNIWLWPVGIATSVVYIWVFFTSKFYADMSLQGYYLAISILGWYWWIKGGGRRTSTSALRATVDRQGAGQEAQSEEQADTDAELPSPESLSRDSRRLGVDQERSKKLKVTRLKRNMGIILAIVFLLLMTIMYFVLDRLTDSPVPLWDSFITTLSIIATWMLARKIFEHWYLWIIVNAASVILFSIKGLYPTVVLYIIYCAMSFVGLKEWRKSL
jgi:nicotinamide mononucleotide transporter